MTNPTIEIELAEILKEIKSDQKSIAREISDFSKEIRQDLQKVTSDVNELKIGQARLEEKVNNLEKDYSEFKESTRINFDDIKELIEKNNNDIKELIEKTNNDIKESTTKDIEDIREILKEIKNTQKILVEDVADLKGAKSLIIPIVVAVTTAILTLVARTISFG